MADKHKTTTDIRHPYYEMEAKLGALQEAVAGDPVMGIDDKLQGRLTSIQAEIDALHAHLNRNYLWD